MAARSGVVVLAAMFVAALVPGGSAQPRPATGTPTAPPSTLILREPKYSSTDANCCPSHYRDRTLRWTGTTFKATIKIRRA